MKTGIGLLRVIFLLAALVMGASIAGAAEVQLAGVRLDSSVVNLLTDPSWGEPEGIGPLAQAAGGGGTPRGGLAATTRQGGGGAPGMGRASGAGLPSASVAGGARQAGRTPAPQAAEKGELRGSAGLQYWLYKKPGGLKVVFGVEPSGAISTIAVQGPFNPEIFTNRGIGLGDSFSDLVNAYGYPDRTRPVAQGLQISYPDQDVVFTLANLRVIEIAIGQPPAQPAAAAQPVARAAAGGGRAAQSARRGLAGQPRGGGQPAGWRPPGSRGRR